MRFASIYLSNYIGIYNGMGLYDIHIDMGKCRHRITTIRGANGSGKSTLMKALSLFPDSNDSFIPGLPARKEIVLVDGSVLYKLVFVHGVKTNGDREVTKAYITKTFGNTAVELNENGNVSSYKEILYSELGLDANFAALSQLSTEDRGLADKKPAERKRFVNSIISSLDTYNAIYKTLSKRSTNYKSMINAVVAKLNVLGDEKTACDSLDDVERRINNLQDSKDQAVANLAKEQSMISLLDPDGSIQLTNTKLLSDIGLYETDIARLKAKIQFVIESNGITGSDLDAESAKVTARKNSLIIQNQIDKNTIESLIRQRESEAEDLNTKVQKLSSLQSGYSFDILMDKITVYQAELDEIRKELEAVGLSDIASISKEEYILALETLKDLDQYISDFKDSIDYATMEKIVSYYLEIGKVPDRINVSPLSENAKEIDKSIEGYKNERSVLDSRMSLLETLKLRPASCIDDSCAFIKDALEFSKQNPKDRMDYLDSMIYSLSASLDKLAVDICLADEYNNAVNRFAVIVREVTRNAAILSKLPNGEMFSNTRLFFERLISGYSFEYMREIYKYIDLANRFDEYKQVASLLAEYQAELKVYESKAEAIDSIMEDIDKINAALNDIASRIDPINNTIKNREIEISHLEDLEQAFDQIKDYLLDIQAVNGLLEDSKKSLADNQKKMKDISVCLEKSKTFGEQITFYSNSLAPLMTERDKLVHSIQMMREYQAEKVELEQNYEYLETIKYYSSPTTGIQLIFMQLYMGKVIALANELLGLLFNGEYVIQPFVINESEFRIPCLGSGYLNDDISSMSSSQIGMISMILSFALLHHSSTRYNIIKLDEIDGPLDYNNRSFFIDVLNRIMDIMGTEQCIMISHNSELQVEDSDVILLRHDENNIDYRRGNIIWSC